MHGDELLGVLLKALPLAVDVGLGVLGELPGLGLRVREDALRLLPGGLRRLPVLGLGASVSLPAWACASERMSSASRWAFSRMSWRWPWISPSSSWARREWTRASSAAAWMAVRYWSAAACAASKTPFRAKEASAREPAFSIFSDRSASFARSWSFSSRRADSLRCSS